MSSSKLNLDSANSSTKSNTIATAMTHKKSTSWGSISFFSVLLVLVLAVETIFVYPANSLPIHELAHDSVTHFITNSHILRGAEYVGVGELQGPEDLAYDKKLGVIYTGCEDGWIKKVHIRKSKTNVENWVNTGGRPLGLVLGLNNELIVADAYKGLLNVSKDGVVQLLTDEAEGKKFKLTDGVDVTKNGMIYFTDASYKYGYDQFALDISGGEPHGRFMSFDPATKNTKVLVRDIYFANGVAVSPDQNYVVFCESPLRRCIKYHVQGSKTGSVDNFIDNLPAVPDNIRYDGLGHFWIGLVTLNTSSSGQSEGRPTTLMEQHGGVLAANLEGKPVAHYYDFNLSFTGCNKFEDDLYCGSTYFPYIIKPNLTQYPPSLP